VSTLQFFFTGSQKRVYVQIKARANDDIIFNKKEDTQQWGRRRGGRGGASPPHF